MSKMYDVAELDVDPFFNSKKKTLYNKVKRVSLNFCSFTYYGYSHTIEYLCLLSVAYFPSVLTRSIAHTSDG
jgi:hypothetical protein